MRILQYGEWKIAVDIEKTKQYYENYKKNDTQANRNFTKYCEKLSNEEQEFFNSLAITPECCEIEHIGVSKKGDFPCGGYYLVCGKYLEYPPENLMTVEELAENDFIDERPDQRIQIGLFQFDFQVDSYQFNEIPENIPDGFICIRFWCEEMKWLLNENPEEIMYEPPHFWELHKIIKEKIEEKKQCSLDLEKSKREFTEIFEKLDIRFALLSKKEIKKYQKQWITVFSPADKSLKEIKKLCLNSHRCTPILWHIFSYDFLDSASQKDAEALFNKENKSTCVIISNCENIAYTLENAQNLTAEILEQFVDVTVTAKDFSWTYSKTHESTCGPYFYKK